jgi:DNA-binding PadR family transcriptional regulator
LARTDFSVLMVRSAPLAPSARAARRRRRGRMFGQGELRLVLLRLIVDQPRHGYELIKAIEEMTAGSYAPSPGTVYPTLSLLEDEGLIREVAGGDEPRKAFEATDQGRAELEDHREEADGLIERLSDHGERHAERGRAFATPEMFRALGNLAQVVKMKARSGGLDDEAIGQIVDLIDEMARKIERL